MTDGIISSKLSQDNQTIVSLTVNDTTVIRPVNTTGKVELKIGVLLPFQQVDDDWTRTITVSGMSAIRMAAAEINDQQLIPGAYITLVEKDSYPANAVGQTAITEAVYSAVTLIQQGVIGVIGDISSSWTSLSGLMTSTLQIPQCSFSAGATSLSDKSQYKYFFRTIPTDLIYVDVILSFIISQNWCRVGILFSDDAFGQQLSEHAIMKSRTSNIRVETYQAFRTTGGHSNIMTVLEQFVETGARVVIVAADTPEQVSLLTIAANMGYVNNEFVWLTIGSVCDDLYAGTQRFNNLIALRQNGTLPPASQNASAISLAARLTDNVTPIDFNNTYNGMISFDIWLELKGYPPYEDFLSKWSRLDSTDYPLAGSYNTSGNEGLAYSCMMMMALGFNNTMYNTTKPINEALLDLASGDLGRYMTPMAFNTSYVGPQGPMQIDSNGDVITANFLIYNMQNGQQAVVGSSSSSGLNLTAPILFHDGTINRPLDAPPRVLLTPTLTSPLSLVVMTVSGSGILFSLGTMALVILFRKSQIFKASSPMFCALELLGFLLSYVSLFFMVYQYTVTSCYVIPIAFHLGYCLIMGNMLAKNYRIFRIFNNIFITRTIVTDLQLFKASVAIVVVQAGLLSLWLGMSTVGLKNVEITRVSYYVTCDYTHPANTVFMTLMATYSIGLLAFATFLAIKTRRVGASYTKYSETKQIGMCVYNILFAGLIGFIVFFLPTADFSTRYYVTAITILWGTTFSLYILFLPKVWSFFRHREDSHYNSQTNSSGSSSRRKEGYTEDDWKRTHANLSAFQSDHSLQPTGEECELFNLEQILASEPASLNHRKGSIGSTHFDSQGNTIQGFVKVHEGTLPLRRVNRYLPFLAHWEMQDIMVFPSSGYFSHFSHLTNRGQVFAYSQASILLAQPEAFILKIHGTGSTDIHIQVRDLDSLEVWRRYFKSNDVSDDNENDTTNGRDHLNGSLELLRRNMARKGSSQSDSNLSQQRLLIDRQNSEVTICSTNTMVDKSDLEAPEAHTSSYLHLPERYDEVDSFYSNTTRRRRSTSLEMLQFHNCTDLSLDHLPDSSDIQQEGKPK